MAEKKIEGAEYRVDLLSAKDAYALLSKIIRLAGPGAKHLPGIMTLAGPTPEDRMLADVAAFAACSEMLRFHGAEALVDLKSEVISIAQMKRPSGEYHPVDLDVDLSGDIPTAELLFDYVLEVQFGNFFDGPKASGPVALALTLVRNIFRMPK